MGVLMPTPNTELTANGYAAQVGPHLQPIEGDRNFRYPHGPRDGPVTNYFVRDWLVGEGEYMPIDPQDRHRQQATVSTRYTAEQAAKNRAIVKRRLHPIAQGVKRARK